jgi:MerR family mercuric resistance operon transcriptional regulator
MSAADSLTIGGLAGAAGVSVETIRFYQRRGLLREPRRVYGAIRRYESADIERLRFIKAAQRLGFSLDAVAELLRLEDGARCDDARALAESRLADVRGRMEELQRIERVLAELVRRCGTTTGNVNCPLIAALQDSKIDRAGF